MSMSWLLLIPLLALLVLKYRKKRNVPLPPGPPGDPIIGNIRSMPSTGADMYFYELGLKYGDVVHLNLMGQSMVILNSVRASTELLDKRGATYSDRPSLPIFELMGAGLLIAFLPYGTEWRKQRAMLQQHFSKEKSKDYRPIQTREARILAQRLLTSSEDKYQLLLRYRFSTAVIIDINYGHQLEPKDDPYLKIAGDCSHVASECGPPGGTPIDVFPFLRYFPSWFPGTFYANFASKSSHKFDKLFRYPYDRIKEQMAKESVRPSVLASLLEDLNNTGGENEEDVKRIQAVAAVSYIAGADTTSSTLSFFLLAMLLYPEVQIKAQEEIDNVLGAGRLPEFQDRSRLPYVECILQETLRWHQAVPAGVPHKSTEDDIYNGMLIPKGSLIVPNSRGMMLDEAVYRDPFKFDPARFLPSPEGRGELYPTAQFGFGRRICPGRHLAEDGTWIVIATILTAIQISRIIGKDGKEIVPEETLVTKGLASHAGPLPCDLKPRSKDAFDILQRLIESS